MIYTAIDTFYLTDDQIENSPSRKDGIDAETETALRIYGCDIIQESGILLKLPQAVMATAQVLFHRFYCKKSFVRFGVKRVAASCVWLAAKLEESPRKAKHVIIVFHRMECRRENLPVEHLDLFSKKTVKEMLIASFCQRYSELKSDLIRTERHLLKEMGFICHVEHPHKFISNYLAALETPPELKQEAWNLANDSLRTTLCVRFKSEVVACGVVYAAARRFQVPLPENPPWWLVFDADQSGIEEVCRVLAHLYSLPKARYISVCKDNDSFARIRAPHSQAPLKKEVPEDDSANDHITSAIGSTNLSLSKEARIKLALDKLKESKKNEDEERSNSNEGEMKDIDGKSKGDSRSDANTERNRERERDRERPRGSDRERGRDPDGRGSRDSERDRDRGREIDRDREKRRERSHHSREKGSGHSDKSRHHSSRDHGEYRSSHSSRDKDRHRHHSYS